MNLFLDLVKYDNLVAPYYATIVYLNKDCNLFSDLDYLKINNASYRQICLWLKQISNLNILHYTTKITSYSYNIYLEESIVKQIRYLYYLFQLQHLKNETVCWVKSCYFWLKLERPFIYQSLKDEGLNEAEKIAFIISRFYRYRALQKLNWAFPRLELLVNFGNPTNKHLELLAELNILPSCYLFTRTKQIWLRKYSTLPLWTNN